MKEFRAFPTTFFNNSLDDCETFYFRNCFNVWDWSTLPVATTAKTDVDRSVAIINGKSRFYNQSTAALYWNCITSFHCVTRSTADGGTSRYFPPASAARYATAVSSASTTLKYSFDISHIIHNFANKWTNYESSISTSCDYNIYFVSVEYFLW